MTAQPPGCPGFLFRGLGTFHIVPNRIDYAEYFQGG